MVGEFTIPLGVYTGPSFCKVVNREIKQEPARAR